MGGTRSEFADFYAATYPRTVAELILLTGNRSDAEDAAQEAYVRCWRQWDRICRYDDPFGWVRRVAYNSAVSRWRSARRLLALRSRLAEEPSYVPDHDWLDLRNTLAELPVRHRMVLLLSAVHGMTTDEIASELGVAPATVRSWMHRARAKVRSHDAWVPEGK